MDQSQESSLQIGNDEIAATSEEAENIFEKLEPEEQEELIATMFSGPLPPPEHLAGYAEVHPEAPEKIFQWVEDQQNHRHKMEENHMNKSFRQSTIGIFSGVLISLVFIVGGIILILLDKEVYGLSVMAPVILSILGIIKHRNNSNRNTENEDSEENT